MKKTLLLLILILNLSFNLTAQVGFSLGTGISGLRNFSPQQKFWAFGQTVQADLHFSPKQSAYVSLDYYTEGTFKNNFTAVAKPPYTTPIRLNYTATGRLTYREFSLGSKHYFKGSYNAEKDINLYGIAGFGYLFARANNTVPVDTDLYTAIPAQGQKTIRKLTFDVGFGAEQPLGGNFFLFAQGRGWLPASSHTSPYLTNQKNVPLAFMGSAGLRVLFGLNY